MENSEASVVLQVEVGHNAYITTLEKKKQHYFEFMKQ